MNTYRAITKETPHSIVSEQYRKLRTSIDYSNFNKEIRVVNFTSTFPSEGKTNTVINLATVYAQSKKKTVLIDMDLRKPKLHRYFHLSNTEGITDYITEGEDYEPIIKNISEYLDIIVAGKIVPFPSEILSSEKIKDLINCLKDKYDRIIIDCPPVTAVTDSTIISSFSDGTIYVIASRQTKSNIAKESINTLKQSGANIIGAVLTKLQKRDQEYGMKYYYYGND